MFQQGQTERWGPWAPSWLYGLSLEFAELSCTPSFAGLGLTPLPVGPASKLSPFHQAPSELKLLLRCSHACPCLWTHCPDLELTSSLVSELLFTRNMPGVHRAVPDPCSLHWTCLAWLTWGAVGQVRPLPCWLGWWAQLPAHLSLQRASSGCFLTGCSSQNLHSF